MPSLLLHPPVVMLTIIRVRSFLETKAGTGRDKVGSNMNRDVFLALDLDHRTFFLGIFMSKDIYFI